jgi:hypothetical protein
MLETNSPVPRRARLGFMAEPTHTVQALGASTWAAFAALVERNNGIFGGCWCMGFHPEPSRTDAAVNRDRKIGKHRWVVTRIVKPRDGAGGSVS